MPIRVLHTADWHLGHRLYGNDRQPEHERFFDWLIETIERRQTDVLLVSGDVFDLGYPSNVSMRLYYSILRRLARTSCRKVVITGGNHDASSTLDAPKALLEQLDIHVVGGAGQRLEDELVVLRDAQGQPELVVAAVPFLRARDIRQAQAGESHAERSQATREGIAAHYRQVAELCQRIPAPALAMGHLYAAGATASDSERDIHVGNLGQVGLEAFPEHFQYVALGHVHRPQRVGGAEHVRYSGSPIPLSFSEREDLKQVLELSFDQGRLVGVESLAVPVFRRLVRLAGSFGQVRAAVEAHADGSELGDWLELEIQEERVAPGFPDELERWVSGLASPTVLKYRLVLRASAEDAQAWAQEGRGLEELAPRQVFEHFLGQKGIQADPDLLATFDELLDWMQERQD